MSKIGKIPIHLPTGVELTVTSGNCVTVKGPKGELRKCFDQRVLISRDDQTISLSVKDAADRDQRALWGLTRALINNMVLGTSQGFTKKLEINGVGYRAALTGKKLQLNLGFSHPIDFNIPDGIDVSVEKNLVTISGIDKHLVGEVAAQIRRLKPPEPYKGKGIKYLDEVIRRKAGKAVKTAEIKK